METKSFKNIIKSNKLNIFFAFLFCITILAVTYFSFVDYFTEFREGAYARKDIAVVEPVEDVKQTEQKRNEAANAVPIKYRIDPSITLKMRDNIDSFFTEIKNYKDIKNMSLSRKIDALEGNTIFDIERSEFGVLFRMDDANLEHFKETILDISNQSMIRGIKESELKYEIDNLKYSFSTLALNDEEKNLGIKIVSNSLRANNFIDQEETEKLKVEARNNIEPIIIPNGTIIVKQGEYIDSYKLSLLRESNVQFSNRVSKNIVIISAIILSMVLVSLYSLIIGTFDKEIFKNKRFSLLLLLNIVVILLSKLIFPFSPYALPILISVFATSVLIDKKVAIITNIALCGYLFIVLSLGKTLTGIYFISSTLSLFIINKQIRNSIIFAGFVSGLVNIILFFIIMLLTNRSVYQNYLAYIIISVSPIIYSIFFVGVLPVLEKLFDISTPMRLMELTNSSSKLLNRMLLEAPATYQHCLMVGNLCEQCALAIGANSLLAKVGALYHDIGKILKPSYFTENQYSNNNIHDEIEPIKSAKIIMNHVSDGIELAKKYKLPTNVIDLIYEHHGTTLVYYFYHKALNKGYDVNELEFRYPNRKPQTKEAAILMLADSCEAACRSIKGHTVDNIKEMIENVFKSKINDKQLDECDITYKEVAIIKNKLIDAIVNIYHERIEYPKSGE